MQARHRRLRRWDVLWAVHSLGLRYRALALRQEQRRRAYEAAEEQYTGPEQEADRNAITECINDLADVQSMEVGCSHREASHSPLLTWQHDTHIHVASDACAARHSTPSFCAACLHVTVYVCMSLHS